MRKNKIKSRALLPDSRYNDIMVAYFVHCMMISGNKSLSYRLFYGAMDMLKDKVEGKTSLEIFRQAVENVTPELEVRSTRVGGSTFQVPHIVGDRRKRSLATRWLVSNARNRKDKTFSAKLASEILAAYNNSGGAFKKKEDMHRMAEANKAFSHFRF